MHIFETERLVGRHINERDAEAMHAVYGDSVAMQFVGDKRTLSLQDCRGWIQVIQSKYAQRGYGMSAIVRKDDRTIIGFCGVVHPNDQIEAEVKYALRRDCWGFGYATEAVSALLAYSRNTLNIQYVIATVNPANLQSQRVLDKAGMERGQLRANADGSHTQLYTWGTGRARSAV